MLYRTLEIKPSATPEDVRTSYRRLALAHHPDRCGGTPEAIARFQEIQKAYEVLSSAEKRAAYDAEISAKRAKFKGFVKPPPFEPGTVDKPVAYRLVDDSMYTFESSPAVTHSGWNYGDILSQKEQSGCYVGVAADQWHYWCVSGTSHATRLCQAGSTFGTSDVKVLYRCNLSAKPVGASATTLPNQRPRTEKEKSEGKKKLEKMKQALQQKERARAVPRLLDRVVAEERTDREEVEGLLLIKLEELHSTIGTLLTCVELGVPLPDVGLEWMNRSLGGGSSMSQTLSSSAGATSTTMAEALAASPSPPPAADGSVDAADDDSHYSANANSRSADDGDNGSKDDDRAPSAGRSSSSNHSVRDVSEPVSKGASAPPTPPVAGGEKEEEQEEEEGEAHVTIVTTDHREDTSPIPPRYGKGGREDPEQHPDAVSSVSAGEMWQSVDFRYTNSQQALSPLDVNASYQFCEESGMAGDRSHETESALFVNLDDEDDDDDDFEFNEEGPLAQTKSMQRTTSSQRSPIPQTDGLPTATSVPALSAAGAVHDGDHDDGDSSTSSHTGPVERAATQVPADRLKAQTSANTVNVAKTEDHSPSPVPPPKSPSQDAVSLSVPHDASQPGAKSASVLSRDSTLHEQSSTMGATPAEEVPRDHTNSPQTAFGTVRSSGGPVLRSEQSSTRNHLFMSRGSSAGNLFTAASATNSTPQATTPQATTPHTGTPRAGAGVPTATTPRTITTTIATTTATASLPPPSVTTTPAAATATSATPSGVSPSGTAPLMPDSSGAGSPRTQAQHFSTWPRTGVPSLSIPIAPTPEGPTPRRDASYPWTVSPATDNLESTFNMLDDGPTGTSDHHRRSLSEEERRLSSGRRVSDDRRSSDLGSLSKSGLAATGPASASAVATPVSAHLSGSGATRRTPRFMQATKSFSSRTNISAKLSPQSNSASPACDALNGDPDASAAAAAGAGNETEPPQLAATYAGRDPHAHKSAQEMFAQELEFMKEFEKKRKGKRTSGPK